MVRKADGRELGKTPLTIEAPLSGSALSVELRLPGFVATALELHPADDDLHLVRLSAERRMPGPRPTVDKKREKTKVGKSFFDGID